MYSSWIWQCQEHSAIYPSRPLGREHKPLHDLDTVKSRSCVAVKGHKDAPAQHWAYQETSFSN